MIGITRIRGLRKNRTGLCYWAYASSFDRYIHPAIHLTQYADESIHAKTFELSIANAADVTVINTFDMPGCGAISLGPWSIAPKFGETLRIVGDCERPA